MRLAPTSGQSGSQTGPQRFEPNDTHAYFLYKVRFFLLFSLLGILLGISAVVLAGCGPPTNGKVLPLDAVPAGLRQGDMSGLPESNDELRKQIPSEVDSACPAQHFADNVTGHSNGHKQ